MSSYVMTPITRGQLRLIIMNDRMKHLLLVSALLFASVAVQANGRELTHGDIEALKLMAEAEETRAKLNAASAMKVMSEIELAKAKNSKRIYEQSATTASSVEGAGNVKASDSGDGIVATKTVMPDVLDSVCATAVYGGEELVADVYFRGDKYEAVSEGMRLPEGLRVEQILTPDIGAWKVVFASGTDRIESPLCTENVAQALGLPVQREIR